jgi:hypothetical protein
MKNILTPETDCEASVISRSVLSDFQPDDPLRLERAAVRPELIGNVYRVGGRAYILNQDFLVFDAETQEAVFDPRIYDKVFDRYEEDLRIAAAIRRKAKALANGDTAIEEALRIHLAFTGMTQEPEQTEDEAA